VLNSRLIQWSLVALLAILAIISRLNFNGLILDFDYGIYQPDGSHYAYRTLTFLGVDANLAATQVVDWYQVHGIKNNLFDVSLLSPENTGTWGLVAPRVLYSILSMPFVYVFGISGMMAIPIMSFFTLIFAVFRMGELQKQQGVGFLLVIGLTTSPTVLRWMIANITDSLLAALFGVVALVLSSNLSKKAWYLSIGILILLTSSTRFCLPIWIAISIVYFLNKMPSRGNVVLLLSSLSFIPTYLLMPENAVLPGSVASSGIQKVVELVYSFFKVGFIELAQLAALDRTLLVLLIISLLLSIMNVKQMSSQFFITILFSVWFIGAINGTLGVNFRYQLPLLAFACWAITSNLSQFPNWDGWRRINIVGKKTQN
jgi:hypothetical protein